MIGGIGVRGSFALIDLRIFTNVIYCVVDLDCSGAFEDSSRADSKKNLSREHGT